MLFEEQISRKPNLYPWTQDIIDALWQSHWTANEFNFRSDFGQFHTELTEQEQGVVVRTLSAIGQIEIAVKRFWGDLGKNLPHPCMTDMGFVMANNEVVHNQAYEKLLEVLQLNAAFEESLKEPVVMGRVQYLRKYLDRVYKDNKKQYIYAIILFSLFVENVSLFGQFYIIRHFNRFQNVLKDTSQQVQYTRGEEHLHAQAGIMIINELRKEYPEYFDKELEDRIKAECLSAIEYEGKVIEWILQGYTGEKLSEDILKAYIKNRLSESMVAIGYPALETTDYEASLSHDYEWADEELAGNMITDFFNKKPTSYAHGAHSFDADDMFE